MGITFLRRRRGVCRVRSAGEQDFFGCERARVVSTRKLPLAPFGCEETRVTRVWSKNRRRGAERLRQAVHIAGGIHAGAGFIHHAAKRFANRFRFAARSLDDPQFVIELTLECERRSGVIIEMGLLAGDFQVAAAGESQSIPSSLTIRSTRSMDSSEAAYMRCTASRRALDQRGRGQLHAGQDHAAVAAAAPQPSDSASNSARRTHAAPARAPRKAAESSATMATSTLSGKAPVTPAAGSATVSSQSSSFNVHGMTTADFSTHRKNKNALESVRQFPIGVNPDLTESVRRNGKADVLNSYFFLIARTQQMKELFFRGNRRPTI